MTREELEQLCEKDMQTVREGIRKVLENNIVGKLIPDNFDELMGLEEKELDRASPEFLRQT